MSQAHKTMSENPAPTPARLLTPAEAAKILGDAGKHFQRLEDAENELQYVHIERLVRYRPEHVAALTYHNTVQPNELKTSRIGGRCARYVPDSGHIRNSKA